MSALEAARLVEKTSTRAEIVLVLNGSTDRSKEICKKFAKKYPLALRVVECQKSSAGAARNLGVLEAKGEFIWFVDADDAVAEDAVVELLRAGRGMDLVMTGAERIYPDYTDYLSAVLPGKNMKSRFIRYGSGPWQFLVRRKWWVEQDFKFREDIIHEDMELMSSLILYTEKFNAIDRPLYFYYQNPDSVLHQKKWNEHEFDIFPALEGLYRRFEKARAVEKYYDELEWFFIWNLLIDASMKHFAKFPEGKVGFMKNRKMLRKYFPKWRRNRFLKEKPLKFRLRCYLNYWR